MPRKITHALDDRQWIIYVLRDPRTDEVRYVGWTYDLRKRLKSHVAQAPRQRTHKAHWINELRGLGLKPIPEEIDCGSGDDWSEAEKRWIVHYRATGARLSNGTDGGDGTPGLKPTPETRARMSASRTGRRMSPESIAKVVACTKGCKRTREQIAAMSAIRKGIVPHAAIAAAAEAVRGKRQSPEHVRKRIAAHIGRPRFDLMRYTDDQVRAVRGEQWRISRAETARRHGIPATTVLAIWRRETYAHVPE